MTRDDRDPADAIPVTPTTPQPVVTPTTPLDDFIRGYTIGPQMYYRWLPAAKVIPGDHTGWEFSLGLNCLFAIDPTRPMTDSVVWHEAGHAALNAAAYLRDYVEGRGAAGEEILREFAIVLGLPPIAFTDGTSQWFLKRSEYFADAFTVANGFPPAYDWTLTHLPMIFTLRAELYRYFSTMQISR